LVLKATSGALSFLSWFVCSLESLGRDKALQAGGCDAARPRRDTDKETPLPIPCYKTLQDLSS
jgi:hypothetical protein